MALAPPHTVQSVPYCKLLLDEKCPYTSFPLLKGFPFYIFWKSRATIIMYFMDTEIAWAVFLWTGRWKYKLQYFQLECHDKDLLEKSIVTLYSFYKAQKIKDILPKTPLTLFWLANFGQKTFHWDRLPSPKCVRFELKSAWLLKVSVLCSRSETLLHRGKHLISARE